MLEKGGSEGRIHRVSAPRSFEISRKVIDRFKRLSRTIIKELFEAINLQFRVPQQNTPRDAMV